jgi:murein L,D-transpeptidase YafK
VRAVKEQDFFMSSNRSWISRWFIVTVLSMLFSLGDASAEGDSLSVDVSDLSSVEQKLLSEVIDQIRSYRIDPAIATLETITDQYPKFKLAQLIYADLLMAKAHAINGFGPLKGHAEEELAGLLDEVRKRWNHYATRPLARTIPAYFAHLNGETKSAVLVDLANSRLYLFENSNGAPALVKDYYISLGKNGARKDIQGDQRTPIGVYHITEYLAEAILPDRYGDGAFPLNYPNEWDRRLNKTGYGIWLHGTPFDTFSRPPRSSDGCVTLSNLDFNELALRIEIVETPVIITDQPIDWLSLSAWEERRRILADVIDGWRIDWESLENDRYLSHYSEEYHDGKLDYAGWSSRKRRVNNAKTYVKVQVSDLSIYEYPGEDAMVVVTFAQDYDSSNYRHASKKRQYWKRESDGVWRIVFEGPG